MRPTLAADTPDRYRLPAATDPATDPATAHHSKAFLRVSPALHTDTDSSAPQTPVACVFKLSGPPGPPESRHQPYHPVPSLPRFFFFTSTNALLACERLLLLNRVLDCADACSGVTFSPILDHFVDNNYRPIIYHAAVEPHSTRSAVTRPEPFRLCTRTNTTVLPKRLQRHCRPRSFVQRR